MVEAKPEVTAEAKHQSKNWADEEVGGDDDDTQIGGDNAP
jgi:hypothetical protein